MDLERLASEYPDVKVVSDVRFVDEGKILTAAGISAGIDMALHIIGKFHPAPVAVGVARMMDYMQS